MKKPALWESLVNGVDVQLFKPLKYIPKPDESTDTREGAAPAPSWFPAIVTEVLTQKVDTHVGVALVVFRPPRFGGILELPAVAFTNTHDPGTCDTLSESDVGSVYGTLN